MMLKIEKKRVTEVDASDPHDFRVIINHWTKTCQILQPCLQKIEIFDEE